MKELNLLTPRLRLRAFQLDDAIALHTFTSDPEVTRYTPWEPHTPAQTRELLNLWMKSSVQTSLHLGIELCIEGALIGWIGFPVLNRETQTGTFGYVVARTFWGQGFATEAARALLHWGFHEQGLRVISAVCAVENAASIRVLEKLGMRREPDVKIATKAGRAVETCSYVIRPEEFSEACLARS